MNHYVCLFLVGLLGLSACNSATEPVTETDEYGNTLTYERNKEDYAKEGWLHKTNPEGVLIEAAQYQRDTLHGERILFNENGDTLIVENYERGQFAGAYRLYHDNGQVHQTGQYENNAMVGEWISYYENGQLREVVQFVNNEENGPFVEYHANGKLAAEGAYLNGDNEHGELKIYDENGDLQRTMDCVEGRCSTTWKAEENTTADGE